MSNVIVVSDSSSDESSTEITFPKPAPRRTARRTPKSSCEKKLMEENKELRKLITELEIKIKNLEQNKEAAKEEGSFFNRCLREAELQKQVQEAVRQKDQFLAVSIKTLQENVTVRTVLEEHLQKENEYRARLNEEPLDIPSIVDSTYILKKPVKGQVE